MTNLSKSIIVTTTTAPNSSIRALIDDANGGGSYDFDYNNNCVYNDICGYSSSTIINPLKTFVTAKFQ
nr:10918_t:CDS:2 [Entrophospora candida]